MGFYEGGYLHDFSMSRRAAEAYKNGLVPASKIKGVPPSLVRQFCGPHEWHHTSKYYNATDFFDPQEVRIIFGLDEPTEEIEFNPDAVAALAKYKADRKRNPVETRHEGCLVKWLEWDGPRAHPRATELEEHGCTVVIRGKTAHITFKNGRTLRKRLDTNGFSFKTSAQLEIEHKRNDAQNPETLPATLRALAADADLLVKARVAANPNIPPDLLPDFANSSDPQIRCAVVKNTIAPTDLLEALSRDADWSVRRCVAIHLNTPELILQELAQDEDCEVRWGVVKNANTTSDILRLLADEEDPKLRRKLAQHPKSPDALLLAFVNDSDATVQYFAKQTLESRNEHTGEDLDDDLEQEICR